MLDKENLTFPKQSEKLLISTDFLVK